MAAVEKKTTFAASSPTSEICLWNLGCKAKKVRAADGASCLHTISAYSTEEASLLHSMTTQSRQTTSEVEASFLRWFRQSGGSLDARCRIQPIPGMGRGMVANASIDAGETIFVIPRHALLNLATSTLAKRCSEAEANPATGSTSTASDALTWKEVSKMDGFLSF